MKANQTHSSLKWEGGNWGIVFRAFFLIKKNLLRFCYLTMLYGFLEKKNKSRGLVVSTLYKKQMQHK